MTEQEIRVATVQMMTSGWNFDGTHWIAPDGKKFLATPQQLPPQEAVEYHQAK